MKLVLLTAALALSLAAFQDPAPPPDAPVPPQGASTIEDAAAYFRVCDYDGNGWISFREASESLKLDRAGFSVCDVDRDGRITPEEFAARYQAIVAKVGGMPPPKPPSPEQQFPTRNAEQLLSAYDANTDRSLDSDELAKLLSDYGRSEFPVDVVIDKLDRNGSGKLEGEELVLFAQLLSATVIADAERPDPETRPRSVNQLFGQVIPRTQGPGTAAEPPVIRGPVGHFRRLDLDDDGGITIADLERLQAPIQISVRLGGIFAALDTDQDGQIDPNEFLQSMQKARN